MSYECTLDDLDDVLGLGCAEVDVRVEYDIDPGWPDAPPSVEFTSVEVLHVTGGPVTRDKLQAVEAWAADELDRQYPKIRRHILEGEGAR
jgi:hypothetical protein